MSTVQLTVIEQVVIIRRRLGLTVQQAAHRWRLNARVLGSWEQGTRTPRNSNAARLKAIVAQEWRTN